MTRLACLALGSLLAGVLIFSCPDQAATAQATPVEDCGCDPQVIVNPVPAYDPEPRDVEMSYEKIERNLGTMVGEAHAEQDFFGVQVRLNSSLVPNAGFARIRAVWTDCKDAGGVSIPLSETDTEFSFEADTLEFEGEIRLEERDATCATLTGDLKVEVPVKFASISFSREDAIGTTKTALQYSATLTSWDPGKITVDVSGTPEASYRLLAYAEGQIPKNMFANYTRSSASARSVAVSFRGTANSATLFIPLESKTFSIPATVQVKQENDSKSVFAPEMIHPIGLPRGYVKANTAVDLEYRADTHLLSVHMPVGAPLELIAIDLLWLRATDSAGNRLNADVSIFNTTNEFSKSWYLYHEWDEPLPDLSKKEEPPELPADLQQKIDEDADLTF
ncbi:MAG: hypothetical protein IT368_10950 [Candidatus Hydrogenedentes bacterium]|nr:hypothetical protein [Candidatus Hydrogenedentota bacterium]